MYLDIYTVFRIEMQKIQFSPPRYVRHEYVIVLNKMLICQDVSTYVQLRYACPNKFESLEISGTGRRLQRAMHTLAQKRHN